MILQAKFFMKLDGIISVYACIILIMILVYESFNNEVNAQSTMNPDISVIPRFRLESNDASENSGKRKMSNPEFTLEEFELALQAYLNPYARADIFLSKAGFEDEPVAIEEGYASFVRGLPFGLNARIGKYRAEFGKLNVVHPHAWSFLTQPLSLERFIGEEGLNDLGLSVSKIIPTGDIIYTKLTLDILTGSAVGTLAQDQLYGGIGLSAEDEKRYANSGRLMTFFPVSENSDVELGISGLTGIHDPVNNYRFYYANIDFKYKWKPSAYKSLTLQGEGLLNRRKIEQADVLNGISNLRNISSSGGYLYTDYQFHKIFSIGGRLDWSQSPYSKDDTAQGFAVFLGYYPVEETTAFRLQYQRTTFDPAAGQKSTQNMIALQFIFSMGPHKAHPF